MQIATIAAAFDAAAQILAANDALPEPLDAEPGDVLAAAHDAQMALAKLVALIESESAADVTAKRKILRHVEDVIGEIDLYPDLVAGLRRSIDEDAHRSPC